MIARQTRRDKREARRAHLRTGQQARNEHAARIRREIAIARSQFAAVPPSERSSIAGETSNPRLLVSSALCVRKT